MERKLARRTLAAIDGGPIISNQIESTKIAKQETEFPFDLIIKLIIVNEHPLNN